MSVTFSPEFASATDDRTFALICEASGGEETVFETVGYSDAYFEAQAHGLTCETCAGYGAEVREINAEPSMNLANRNAMDVLALLGYVVDLEDPDLCGTAEPADFLARITLARGMQPDGPAVYIDSYLMDRLADLWEVATYAAEHGRRITWG